MTAAIDHPRPASAGTLLSRRFPLTDLPVWLLLVLVSLGVPRTILADLNIVPPESGPLYYILALVPFTAWLAVAAMRRSRRPLADFLMVGLLYGLSLVIIHLALWDARAGYGNLPPAGAAEFADGFGPGWGEVALPAYAAGIATMIGLGSGLVVGLCAVTANAWRRRRARASRS